jgi:hypothetical protein
LLDTTAAKGGGFGDSEVPVLESSTVVDALDRDIDPDEGNILCVLVGAELDSADEEGMVSEEACFCTAMPEEGGGFGDSELVIAVEEATGIDALDGDIAPDEGNFWCVFVGGVAYDEGMVSEEACCCTAIPEGGGFVNAADVDSVPEGVPKWRFLVEADFDIIDHSDGHCMEAKGGVSGEAALLEKRGAVLETPDDAIAS